MKLNKTICRIRSAPARREAGLVATVTLLADLIESGAVTDPTVGPEVVREIARLAVVAAMDTETRLADHERQVAELERLAVTDPLTGLLNRRGIEIALGQALAAARRHDEHGVLISIDLDGFKFVNDSCGHAVGDRVLKQVARLLVEGTRGTDHAGRIGGDEFIVLLTRVAGDDGLRRARALEEQINGTVLNIDGRSILLRASCGAQVFGSGDDETVLLSRADAAMYRSKRAKVVPENAIRPPN